MKQTMAGHFAAPKLEKLDTLGQKMLHTNSPTSGTTNNIGTYGNHNDNIMKTR